MEPNNFTYRLFRKLSFLVPRLVKLFYVPQSIRSKKTIYIKIPVPFWSIARSWGDYYFALGIKKSFEKIGYCVKIHCVNEWNKPHIDNAVVLVIRGLYEYTPRPNDLNLMWVISHPEKFNPLEHENYHHIFIASQKFITDNYNSSSKVSLLDQCTDPELFYKLDEVKKDLDLLFIGNSRNEYRTIVKHAIDQKLPITVIGRNWEKFIDKKYILKESVKNEDLNYWYNRAKIVLNDHWDSMRTYGFVSNRIFDATASGACVISDLPEGDIDRIKSKNINFYNTPNELKTLVNRYLESNNFNSKILNTFDNCCSKIISVIDKTEKHNE